MYKLTISNEIIKSHREHIKGSNISYNIKKLKADNKYIGIIGKEHELFCDFILNQLNELDGENIFLCQPCILNKFIKEIESKYRKVIQEIYKKDSEYCKEILKCFGYEEFTKKNMESYYRLEKDHIKNYSEKKIREQLNNINSNTPYIKETFIEHLKNIENDINKIISINEEDKYMKEIFSEFKNKVIKFRESIDDKFTKNMYVTQLKQIHKIVKDEFNKLEKKFKEDNKGLSILNYKDYDKRKSDRQWGAYEYVMALGIKVCPYCNRQFITPIYSEKSKMRADLDHFFSKSRYPYLSMSIYNLIPSCKFCNSSLKGNKEFTYEEYLNPFEEAIDDYVSFNFDFNSAEALYGSRESDIKIVVNERRDKKKDLIRKASNNMELFAIENTYQYHTDIVKSLIRQKVVYSESYVDSIWSNFGKLFNNKSEVIEFVVTGELLDDKKNRPLNKLRDDIMEELDFNRYNYK